MRQEKQFIQYVCYSIGVAWPGFKSTGEDCPMPQIECENRINGMGFSLLYTWPIAQIPMGRWFRPLQFEQIFGKTCLTT